MCTKYILIAFLSSIMKNHLQNLDDFSIFKIIFFFCNRTITILKEQQMKNQSPVHLSLSLSFSRLLALPFLSLSLAANSQGLSAELLLERRGRLFREGKQGMKTFLRKHAKKKDEKNTNGDEKITFTNAHMTPITNEGKVGNTCWCVFVLDPV